MIEDSNTRVQALVEQAEAAIAHDELDRARRLATEALGLNRDCLTAWLLRARLADNPWEERTAWERVLDLDPYHPEARAFLGQPADQSPVAVTPAEPAAERTLSWPQQWQSLVGLALFAARRLAFGALVLVAITFLSYFGLDMARGTSFRPALTGAVLRTPAYLARLIRGDPGLTAAGSLTLRAVPITDVVPTALSLSLGLLATSLLIATFVGVVFGIWAAGRRHSGWSLAILLVSIVGVSVPSFVAAVLLQLGMIQWVRIFGRPLLPIGGSGWDKHLILPALVLAARPIAQIFRVTFVSVGDVLDQDYVRTAHSKGLKPRHIMRRHVIRNAAIPILTTVGLSLSFSLSSLPVVEFFFGWPGVGATLLKAISRQDDNLTVILALCLGALFILVNLVLEVSYRLINPSLRESSVRAERRERGNLLDTLALIATDARELIADNPVRNWLNGRHATASPSPFRAVLEQQRNGFEVDSQDYASQRRRAWLRGTAGNLPFVTGAILIALLLGVFVFGPQLAPHSPYTKQGISFSGGELSVPPFAPNATYPWGTDGLGRDMMSLVLAGAQQTLILATLVVVARMLLGFILGAVAGWLSGSWVDRLLLGIAETIAAFPTLLLAMILILALGIRQGVRPFVIALCFVGWGGIMQFVRAEVLSIRPKPFIESAIVVGLRTPRIIANHVLPNLVPALISIAALEMGAVLMLLGELGFIGIFIGGGASAELTARAPLYQYSDVPEWGALLSNVRLYARAYPWTAIYPAMAFFVAILGFNLFGEGVRRMVESVGVGTTRLINRYTLAAAVLVILGIGWVRGNTGAIVFYRQQAGTFNGQRALTHVQALTQPSLDGQALGTPGLDATAEYIAQQFEDLGLQAAGKDFTYFYARDRSFESLDAVPLLTVEDGGQPSVYRQDFTEYPGPYRNLGQAHAPVRFLAMGDITTSGIDMRNHPALQDLDYTHEILLMLSDKDISYIQEVPWSGLLFVAQDPLDLQRRHTLSTRDPFWRSFSPGRDQTRDRPILWISEATANRILAGTGHTVADLRRRAGELGQDEVFNLPTGVTASMEVQGTIHEQVPVRHVIGHLPGTSAELDNHMIMVLAQYDSPPPGPDGVNFPAANDNASGVAVMLEAIRVLQETGYQPYKTFLFVAYSGEGLEGGEVVSRPEPADFLKAKYGFTGSFDIEAVIRLRGLGAGQGARVVVSAGESLRLANLFKTAAGQMGVGVSRAREPVDLSVVYQGGRLGSVQAAVPDIRLNWEGWEATSRSPADTLETVSADNLQQSGRALALALMVLGRETQY